MITVEQLKDFFYHSTLDYLINPILERTGLSKKGNKSEKIESIFEYFDQLKTFVKLNILEVNQL